MELTALFNTSTAAATLPPSLLTAYLSWQPTGGREARLGRLTAMIAADFRAASGYATHPDYAATPAAVPLRSVRHCEAVLWYTLALECGAAAEAYRSGWQDSEVWLRQLYVTQRQGGGAGAAPGTPRYDGAAGPVGGSGGATGGINGAPGDINGAPGVVTGPINYQVEPRPVRMTLY